MKHTSILSDDKILEIMKRSRPFFEKMGGLKGRCFEYKEGAREYFRNDEYMDLNLEDVCRVCLIGAFGLAAKEMGYTIKYSDGQKSTSCFGLSNLMSTNEKVRECFLLNKYYDSIYTFNDVQIEREGESGKEIILEILDKTIQELETQLRVSKGFD